MGRRFSRYKWAINNDMSGANVAAYKLFIDHKSSYKRNVPENQGRNKVHLNPFSFDLDSGEFARVTITENSIGKLGGLNLSLSLLGLALETPATAINAEKYNFSPAKINASLAGGQTKPTSKITGLEYTTYAVSALSAPFGRIADTDRDGARFAALKAAVQSTNSKNSCSYIPERKRFN